MEPLERVAMPPEMADKINELVQAYNDLMEGLPGGMRRRIELRRERSTQVPEITEE